MRSCAHEIHILRDGRHSANVTCFAMFNNYHPHLLPRQDILLGVPQHRRDCLRRNGRKSLTAIHTAKPEVIVLCPTQKDEAYQEDNDRINTDELHEAAYPTEIKHMHLELQAEERPSSQGQ